MRNPKQCIKEYLTSVISVVIEDDEDIFQRGIVDSLFAVQLVVFVEQQFSLTLEPTDLDINNFCSVSALTRFVEYKMAKVVPNESEEADDI